MWALSLGIAGAYVGGVLGYQNAGLVGAICLGTLLCVLGFAIGIAPPSSILQFVLQLMH
jgi:hypothetical protein